MDKNNKSIDYGGAMKDLLKGLKESEKTIRGNTEGKYAFAYGQATMAIKMCLVVCTDLTFDDIYRETNPAEETEVAPTLSRNLHRPEDDPNDIPENLFTQTIN